MPSANDLIQPSTFKKVKIIIPWSRDHNNSGVLEQIIKNNFINRQIPTDHKTHPTSDALSFSWPNKKQVSS